VAEEDPPIGGAHQPDRRDRLRLAEEEGLRTGQSRIGRPAGEGDRHHRAHDAGPPRGNEGEGQDQAGQSEEDVTDPHEDEIDDPAGVACDEAHEEAKGGDQPGHRHHHAESDAPAIEQTGIEVAPHLVGAEPVLPTGRGEPVGEVGTGGIGRAEPGRGERNGEEEEQEEEAPHRQSFTEKGPEPAIEPAPGRLAARGGVVGEKPGGEAPGREDVPAHSSLTRGSRRR
jgi:hypothetical protein